MFGGGSNESRSFGARSWVLSTVVGAADVFRFDVVHHPEAAVLLQLGHDLRDWVAHLVDYSNVVQIRCLNRHTPLGRH